MKNFEIDKLPSRELAPGVVMRSVYLTDVMVSFVTLKAGAVVPLHRHQVEQISLVISGQLRFTVDGEEKDIGPGETLLIPSNAEHGVTVITDAVAYDVFSQVRPDYVLQPC